MPNVSYTTENSPPSPDASVAFKYITVTDHPNGIHEVVFIKSTYEGLQELVTYQRRLLTLVLEPELIRELHNYRVGLPPISLAIREIRQLLADPAVAKRRFRLALLYPRRQSLLMSPFSTLFSMMQVGNMKTRAFPEHEADEAVEWLLKN